MQIPQCFNDATNFFSHVYKPTSHEFLEQALNIASAFNKGEKIEEISHSVLQLKLKWLNYFKFIPDFYLFAFIFDPRITNKFVFSEKYF